MKKNHLKILIWLAIIIYGLFIYPHPEEYPVLTGRLSSFLVMLLTASTFFINDKK